MGLASKDVLNAREAATYLGISLSTLYKLTGRREIPYYKPSGKLIFFLEKELRDWVTSKRIASASELAERINQY